MTRLPSHVLVGALRRLVSEAGGSAMVLARGDRDGGMILVLASERGECLRFFERGFARDGKESLIQVGPAAIENDIQATEYWQRRRKSDPDLWVLEVDIAGAERFAAETIVGD